MANSMTYDSKSFIAGNKRLFIHSAAIHYFRFPKEEWREVLWKAKLAGITCIDTYFAWNVHEPQEGIWNFEEEADCDAFLSLCHELGLQVIARPGPYICAEWDFGGFPWWLNNKEKMRYRAYDPRFLSYVDRYFDKLIPIIAKHQVTKGGSVILVQVENEYQHLASDEEGKEYLEYLRDGLRSRGIEVPLITCEGAVEGAVECANFWSGADRAYDKLRQKQPDTPKIVTEFWTGWFERWGGPRADHKTAALLERRIMEVLRAGFTGLNHYMFCGGTNFGSYGGRTVDASDVFNVTSYDYDAPLSEYLAYTPKYQAVKRLGYFIQSMYDFFVQSEERAADVKMSCEGRVRKRIHGETVLYFVEHTSDERMSVHFTTETGETYQVTVNPGEIAPVLIDLPILSGWKLTYNAYLGGFHEIEGILTLVVFSDDGQRSRMRFKTETELQFEAPASVLCYRGQEPGVLELELVHFETPQIIRLSDGIRQTAHHRRLDTHDGPRMVAAVGRQERPHHRSRWHRFGERQAAAGGSVPANRRDALVRRSEPVRCSFCAAACGRQLFVHAAGWNGFGSAAEACGMAGVSRASGTRRGRGAFLGAAEFLCLGSGFWLCPVFCRGA